MLDRKVYSGWAFKDDGDEMARINMEIYKELKPKIKMCYIDYRTKIVQCTNEDMEKYCCIVPDGHGYGNQQYKVLSNPHNLSNDELALVCDGGNLCFGYRGGYTSFIIYTD